MTKYSTDNDANRHWYQRPVAWAFMFLFFLISIISLMSAAGFKKIQNEFVQETEVHIDKLRLLDEMVHFSRQRTVLLRDIVIAKDPFEQDEIIQEHERLATRYYLARTALNQLSLNRREQDLMATIVGSNQQSYPLQISIIDLSVAGEADAAVELLSEELAPNRNIIYTAMLDMRELLVAASKKATDEMEVGMATARQTVFWLYGIAIFTGMLVAWMAYRRDRESYKKIAWQASHDGLTGLLNRHEFEKYLAESVNRANASECDSALLYIDIDQFNMVNNTSGHKAGDELLRQMASCLQNCIEPGAIAGRMGGDQFAVLIRSAGINEAKQYVEKLLGKTRENRFVWMERSYDVTLSVGILLTNAESGNLEDIWTGAYISCDLAKEGGGNQFSVYQPKSGEVIKRKKQLDWASRIKSALGDEKLILYSQPIRGVDNSCKHSEVLLRLENEDGSIIPAGQFIPAAERYKLITEVDLYVTNKVLEHMAQHRDGHSYSINLSGASLGKKSIAREILNLISRYDVDPELICFEVTETTAITNKTTAIRFMNILHGLGCHFFLDDFGSGLSSFGYLRTLPIDTIKIDGHFVKNIDSDPANLAVVKAINTIAHGFGLHTIAECVEDEAQLEQLKAIGVDFFQGYYIQKPARLMAA